MKLVVEGRATGVAGRIRVPGDKSIAHRAALFAALADGPSVIRRYPDGADNASSLGAVAALGCEVRRAADGTVRVVGHGGHLTPPSEPIDCGNSGTTARLLAGLLAGRGCAATLIGDASLSVRPMGRIVDPLAELGAQLSAQGDGRTLPLAVTPAPLHPADVSLRVASAQVKSAVLLAGLGAAGTTRVTEPAPSRDHTERLLARMGAPLRAGAGWAEVDGPVGSLAPLELTVPADPSSAAFFCVLGALVPGGPVELPDVLMNPTRVGFLRALDRMGATIGRAGERTEAGEPVCDLVVRPSPLRAVELSGDEIPAAIDELCVLAVAMTQAEGTSVVSDAAELRVKECDRITAMVEGLRAFGASIEERPDGFVVHGPSPLRAATPATHGDHRVVMSLAVAAALADGTSTIDGAEHAAISYPAFAADLAHLGVRASTSG